MKRRKFVGIGAAGLLGAPLASTGADRLYGTPKSSMAYQASNAESNFLKLSLAKQDIPVDTWDTIVSLQKLYGDSLNDPTILSGLFDQHSKLLENYHLDSSQIDLSSPEIRMLRSMLDSGVRQAATSGDFREYLTALERSGSLEFDGQSKLGERVKEYLLANKADFQDAIGHSEQLIANLSSTGNIVPAVVATLAVLLTVAVAAILALATATVVIVNLDVATTHPPPGGAAPAPGSKVLMMDHEEFEKMQNAVRVAGVLGGKDLVRSAYDHVVTLESEAIVEALLDVYFRPHGGANKETVAALQTSVKNTLQRVYGLV